MKKKAFVLIGIAVLIVIGMWTMIPKKDVIDKLEEVVKEMSVKKADIIIDFIADGNVSIPENKQNFLSAGLLEEVFVTVGDTVQAGDLVSKLETKELDLKLAQAELSLLTESEKLSQNEKDVVLDVKKQDTSVSSVRLNLEEADTLLLIMTTYPGLYSVISIEDQGRKVTELKTSLSLENALLNSLKDQDVTLSNLAYEQAKLNIELIKLDIENAYIYARNSGTIAYLNDQIGTNMTSATLAVIIQDPLDPKVISDISELDIYQVYLGQKVNLNFESDYGVTFEGMIEFINPIPNIDNNGIVTYEVIIDLIEYPEQLRSGLSTMLNIVLKEKIDIIVVPNIAVTIADNKQYIEVKTNDKIEKVHVITGLTDGMSVEVIQGINVGDIVITRIQK